MLSVNHHAIPANRSILHVAAQLRTALPYLLYAAAAATSCGATDRYAAVLDRFTGATAEGILTRLAAGRPAVLDAVSRAQVIAALPTEGEITRLTPTQQRKLDALGPVLRAHQRDGIYLVKVVEGRQARLGLHARFVVLISETALAALSPVQLQASVAHEMGHEYVWEEFETARSSGDRARLRELELFCDGIAAVTLARLDADPVQWIAALERLYAEDRSRGIVYANENDHPTLADRREFVKRVRSMLAGGKPRRP
jgi:hypothetical protein